MEATSSTLGSGGGSEGVNLPPAVSLRTQHCPPQVQLLVHPACLDTEGVVAGIKGVGVGRSEKPHSSYPIRRAYVGCKEQIFGYIFM